MASQSRVPWVFTSARRNLERLAFRNFGLCNCWPQLNAGSDRLPVMDLDWTHGRLAEGLRCYRGQEFFAAHEHWENEWLASQEPEKTFLQALIQVAAAFHHFRRGNPEGTRLLLQAALRRLEIYPDSFAGVSVILLSEGIREWLHALESGQTSEPVFPLIKLST